VLLQAVNYLIETQEHESDANSHYARTRVRAEWARSGVDLATAQWHAHTYRGALVAKRTAATAGYLSANGAPVLSASYIDVDGVHASAESGVWYKGWHLVVWGDPTIYTIDEDTLTVQGDGTTVVDIGDDHEANALDLTVTPNLLYFADSDDRVIRRVSAAGGSATTIITGAAAIRGVALDTTNDHIYFTETTKLRRCDQADGGNATDLLTIGGAVLRGVAIDAANSKLYYTSTTSGLRRCDLNGSNDELLIAEAGSDDFWDVKLDVTGSKVYFSDAGNGTIERCALDGTGRTTIIGGATTNVRYFALDITNAHIYYGVTGSTGYIYRVGITGTPAAIRILTLADHGIRSGLSIDPTNKRIYYGSGNGIQYYMPLHGVSNARVKVSPVVTTEAAAAGDNARVHVFVPQDAGGQFYSHPKGYTIALSEEFVTPRQRVYSPEP
jgi:hypothetical protein